MSVISSFRSRLRCVSTFWALVGALAVAWVLPGCQVVPQSSTIVAASAGDVQEEAWANVQELTAELGQVDGRRYPGVAALVSDLRAAAARVDAGTGGSYEMLDPAKLIAENPNFWQAMAEMDPGDSTLAVLEGMVLAAAGHIEAAQDALELAEAGPLMEDELGRRVAAQLRTIDAWSLSPPGVQLLQARSLPPEEQWSPVKKVEASFPESATAAMAVLRMRAELADIELTEAEGDDERMRTKILAAEPRAVKVLEEKQPLWAAILKADGEAGDAGRRIAKMLEPDLTGVLNLSAEDWEQLIADFDRIGLPDWALRALRMRAAESGGLSDRDLTAMRQLLPKVLPAATAERLVDALESGSLEPVALRVPQAEPTGTEDWPIDPVVGGSLVSLTRQAEAVLEDVEGEPETLIERSAVVSLAQNALLLGDLERAERELLNAATVADADERLQVARLKLAMMRGERGAVVAAQEELRKVDRGFKQSYFTAGNSFIQTGDWEQAMDVFAVGFKHRNLEPERRAYAALYSHAAARLAGRSQEKMLREALELVEEDEWVARLILTVLGEVEPAQLMVEADEGRHYVALGQRCEAHFVLAFTPGQTTTGRNAELEACIATGVSTFIEYEFAQSWLRAQGGR
ncbi:tetratricopeptide repeat protein [Actomonas aquatica]|uniref:Tetratricopeptide repeat protein n=1 Tax=Actomonas aquatica TaxID=2866162 RepID=A0ABZ1C747_9BACT|nr:hypothetical protein [Opitutus sp. WL0086]WRQ87200.1 hypothetical protein K1X11_020500 [Opitutus sp. WL0086]